MIKYLNGPFLFIFGAIILAFHALFLMIGNFYKIWWADIALHFSGGILVGLFAIWFIFNKAGLPIQKEKLPFYFVFISVISFAALIGVLWEFYEFILDEITGYKSSKLVMQENLKDTMGDLFFDLLGASLSLVFLKFKKQGYVSEPDQN